MERVMGLCGGLVGPKSENVEKVLVSFFEGSREPRVIQEKQNLSGPTEKS